MELITNYQLSHRAGNAIIRFFNKHSNLKSSPLPFSVRIARKFLNNTDIPYVEFKETSVMSIRGIVYKLNYRPIIQAIASLLAIDDINQNLVLNFIEKQLEKDNILYRVYDEQFNCNLHCKSYCISTKQITAISTKYNKLNLISG